MGYETMSPEHSEMNKKELEDITDYVDGATYFSELLKDLNMVSRANPEQMVQLEEGPGEMIEFKLKDLITAYETFHEYVLANKVMLKGNPEKVRAYLDGEMAATGILHKSKTLKDAAVTCGLSEIGVAHELPSM